MAGQADFDSARFELERKAAKATWGRPVRFLRTTPSTNDLALAAASTKAKTGIVWLTLAQTAGRGRRGNRWHAREGESLLMSVLLRWPRSVSPVGVSLAAGLAVRATCQELVPRKHFRVKWPNDVLCEGKKVAGILVETRTASDAETGVVIGVGLNLLTDAFDGAWGTPTSLVILGAEARDLQLERVLALLLRQLETRVGTLIAKGATPLSSEACEHDALLGKRVRIVRDQEVIVGTAVGWSQEGLLRVDTDRGIRQVESGHVEDARAPGDPLGAGKDW